MISLPRKYQIALGAGIVGVLGGVFIASNGFRDSLAKTVSIAGGAALPAIALTHFIIDTKAQRKINDAERLLDQTQTQFDLSLKQLSDSKQKIEVLTNQLTQAKEDYSARDKAFTEQINQFSITRSDYTRLEGTVEEFRQQVVIDNETIQFLTAQLEEWEKSFHTKVAETSEERFKIARDNEIQKIFDEHDAITQKAMSLFTQLQSWGHKVATGHVSKGEIIKSLANSYNGNLDDINHAIGVERDGYLNQIDLLNEKVARLQQELAGDLVEPLYGDFGFDINGRIANELARTIWQDLQLPLAVKGFQSKSDGVIEIGFGYSRSISPQQIIQALTKYSDALAKKLGIFKITSVRKLEITDCIVVSFRQIPAVKDDEIKLMVGSSEQFISYITTHPIRYRLIADPGVGKTPTTAVMISEILKTGCTRGNTGKGEKVPNILVTVSYPGAVGSLKDADYPLDMFLKYGDTTAAIKSFDDCLTDGQYRVNHPDIAGKYFHVWVWDELDNTLNSCSEPYKAGENLKKILKQFGHNNIGWIVSGQSVMTKQIPGFTNDDRSLFTEIIIDIPKIRTWISAYGVRRAGESNISKLSKNLDQIQEYIDYKNEMITDDARLLRVALVVDNRSPKLYFLPNLDNVSFNYQEIEAVKRQYETTKAPKSPDTFDSSLTFDAQNPYTASTDQMTSVVSFPTIGGSRQSVSSHTKPHCPHCTNSDLTTRKDGRFYCLKCKKITVANKIVFK